MEPDQTDCGASACGLQKNSNPAPSSDARGSFQHHFKVRYPRWLTRTKTGLYLRGSGEPVPDAALARRIQIVRVAAKASVAKISSALAKGGPRSIARSECTTRWGHPSSNRCFDARDARPRNPGGYCCASRNIQRLSIHMGVQAGYRLSVLRSQRRLHSPEVNTCCMLASRVHGPMSQKLIG